ncbi:MAG: helix-turn-helix domain-containing protein, partial [Pseudomonadota bacterium]
MSDDKSDDLPTGPGSELRETREGMEVSVREVADALNLPARVIEALESDDYEGLPPTVFTRGYLRSYARLLELSPDALLSRYPEVTEEVDVITGESAVTPAASADSNPQLLYGGFALAALVVIVLAWVFLGGEDSPAPEPIVEAGSESEASRGPPAATATNTVEDAPSSELAQADDREPGAGQVPSERVPGARVQNEREARPEPEPEPAATSSVEAALPTPVPETTIEEQPALLPEPQRDVSPAESGATIAADPVADPAEQDPAVPAAPSDAGSEISDDA